MYNIYLESAEYIKKRIAGLNPKVGLILGSGLGELGDELDDPIYIEYKDIPHFPVSTVPGHKSRMAAGKLRGKDVIVLQGRFHFYEGYSLNEITWPVRVLKLLGINNLIVTNAAGGINRKFSSGSLMMITDHINLLGSNPLRGTNIEEFGLRFPDMTEAYSGEFREKAREAGRIENVLLEEGVYLATSGPSYETPAEIRFMGIIGADAVGMSTVPEVIVANHCGMEVLGISCITNMAAGLSGGKLDHSEVVNTAARIRDDFKKLIKKIIELI